MKYQTIKKGVFVSRPNRFIAKVNIDSKEETVHVKNTGRCRELLVSGATVYLEYIDSPHRKTQYDLIAVEKIGKNNQKLLINMDSQIPNFAVEEFLKKGNIFSLNSLIKREVTYRDSRFDIYVEDANRKAFVEVKGVTLERDGIALFPDAPTARGIKHIKDLIAAKKEGYEAFIFFVIQMKGVHSFSPNAQMQPEFALALNEAAKTGIEILAYDCIVTKESIEIDKKVSVNL